MTPLHLSKFSIFIISVMVIAFAVYGIMVYSSTPDVSKENERIYLHSLNYFNPQEGYVKVSDMKPNSFGVFMYPSSYNYSDPANDYQKFLLIRLPSWLGGNKDDVSAYRAYSMLDVESHCLIMYAPKDGRQVIEDPCHFEKYRLIDGASYFFGINFMSKPIEDALPQLDLGVDNEGYLFVKPPTWEFDKNGIVGDGRHLSKDQVLQSSRILLQDYQNSTRTGINIPLEFDDGQFFLIDITPGTDQTQFHYTSDNATTYSPTITLSYCNCTKPSEDNALHDFPRTLQVWKLGDKMIYADPAFDIRPGVPYYRFFLYENDYELMLNYVKPFDEGMKLVLDSFFNGSKLSDLQHITDLNSITVGNTDFTINYTITGDNNRLVSAELYDHSPEIILSLESSNNGTLTVTLPRALIDAKSAASNEDNKFIVLADNQEIEYKEIYKTFLVRTLSIPFQHGVGKIIIAAGTQI